MKKHQPFPDRRSRDLFPKPFSKHYTERFPWTEPDHPPTDLKFKLLWLFGSGGALALIIIIAELAKKYGF